MNQTERQSAKESLISQRDRVERKNHHRILEITGGVVLSLLAFTACSPNDSSQEAVATTIVEKQKDVDNLFNPTIIDLNEDTTPLDYDCAYWVKDGEINQFSGPLPNGEAFNLFVTINVLSEDIAKIGPFTVTEGQRIGFLFTYTNDIIPVGLVKTIRLGQIEIIPVIPERGANYCPTDEKN